ncbi:MAG: lipoyl(octanoyl) transferase, partial [Methanosarcinales archaeon]
VADRGGGIDAEGGDIVTLPACTDLVLSLQHEHVYTLGRGAAVSDLLFDPACTSAPAAVHRTERGGKITYHGPGQLVVYPILHLAHFRKDLHWYVSSIEQVVIDSLAEYGIEAHRSKGNPGVWVGDEKVAQIGINCSKWVTQHGFAINVCPEMSYFRNIIPCGIADKGVTSVSQLLGRRVSVLDVERHVQTHFSRIFGAQLTPRDGQPLLRVTDAAQAVQRLV